MPRSAPRRGPRSSPDVTPLPSAPFQCGVLIPFRKKIKFLPEYLRETGYYCTNCAKEDYNTVKEFKGWHESSQKATYRNRPENTPFFHVQNFGVSHESCLHQWIPTEELQHDPALVQLPPYHPDIPEMRHDWAQYYDKVSELDRQIGEFLKQLEEDGLSENTIVVYYGDHGGVLGRSKRYIYETGTRVPMIVHFPEKYKYLSPVKTGSAEGRVVSFVDLAPTMLSLAGIETPDYMQGNAFLGKGLPGWTPAPLSLKSSTGLDKKKTPWTTGMREANSKTKSRKSTSGQTPSCGIMTTGRQGFCWKNGDYRPKACNSDR